MTKDVLVTVKGLQSMEDGSPPEEVEMVARGESVSYTHLTLPTTSRV